MNGEGWQTYWLRRWAEALRTTSAPQVKYRLYSPDDGGMCAIGVLCHEMIQDGVLPPWDVLCDASGDLMSYVAYDSAVDPVIAVSKRNVVTNGNDHRGATFAQIAEYIDSLIENSMPAPAPENEAVLVW